ncbi:hypothetical protein BDZ89DRAFT_1152092 [Hymenopellis radicata]|nr:hypothetical protein BDZ89DRAFT_1152092 [Hymenopellis radicata]
MSQVSCPTCGILNGPTSFSETPTSLRVLDLLSTNIPPHDAEVADLRQIVQNSSALVQSLQDHINKVQDTLSSLRSLHETASRRLADAKCILHPIRSLPRDILSEIFLSCTPIADETDSEAFEYGPTFDTLCPRNHPWNLSHVCRTWREITLSLPRLWTTVYLNFEQYKQLSYRQCIFKSILLFERSANLDLSLALTSDENGIAHHPLMGYLEASTMRWRALHCRIPTSSLQAFSGCTFPLLEELGVGCREGIDPATTVDVFSHVPNVRTLKFYMSDGTIDSYSVLSSFPWNPPSIEELTLTLGVLFSEFRRDGFVTLAVLKHLEINEHEYADPGCLSAFLDALRAPFLRRLALTFVPGRHIFFVDLSSHPDLGRITSLHIRCSMAIALDDEEDDEEYPNRNLEMLLKFLRLATGVEEFQLVDNDVPPDFLRAFILEGTEIDAAVLPSLRKLDIHECEIMHDDAEPNALLLALAESRSTIHMSVGLRDRLCKALHTFRLPKSCHPFQHSDDEDKHRWTNVANEIEIVCS